MNILILYNFKLNYRVYRVSTKELCILLLQNTLETRSPLVVSLYTIKYTTQNDIIYCYGKEGITNLILCKAYIVHIHPS